MMRRKDAQVGQPVFYDKTTPNPSYRDAYGKITHIGSDRIHIEAKVQEGVIRTDTISLDNIPFLHLINPLSLESLFAHEDLVSVRR